MQLDHLNVLAAFLTIAEDRSFTKAAKRLGVSRSALSHAVRGLEERLGVRLLARTTRSVAPTEAGEQLISRSRPALGEVESVLDQIVGLRERPTGRVRLLVTPLSATMVLAPKLVPFARRFPGHRPRRHHDARGTHGARCRGLRRRHSPRRIDSTRHGGRARVSRSPAGCRGFAGLFRGAPQAEFTTRFAELTDASTCAAAPAGRTAGSSREMVRPSSLM